MCTFTTLVGADALSKLTISSVSKTVLQSTAAVFAMVTFGVGSLELSVKLGRLVIFDFLSNSLL